MKYRIKSETIWEETTYYVEYKVLWLFWIEDTIEYLWASLRRWYKSLEEAKGIIKSYTDEENIVVKYFNN